MKISNILVATSLLVAFLTGLNANAADHAFSVLESRSDSIVQGDLEFSRNGHEVRIKGMIIGLEPNSVHGVHIHEKGDCSSEDAKSAGGHFNPTEVRHGTPYGLSHHIGDLGNIRANAKGVAVIDRTYNTLSLDESSHRSILNKAFIVHSEADDFISQPSGDAGKRVACGKIIER